MNEHDASVANDRASTASSLPLDEALRLAALEYTRALVESALDGKRDGHAKYPPWLSAVVLATAVQNLRAAALCYADALVGAPQSHGARRTGGR